MTETIKASEIEPGMILSIYGNAERVDVEQVRANGYGAVLVRDHIGWRGLSENETVTVLGHFNP